MPRQRSKRCAVSVWRCHWCGLAIDWASARRHLGALMDRHVLAAHAGVPPQGQLERWVVWQRGASPRRRTASRGRRECDGC